MDTTNSSSNYLTIAYLNILGQTGLNLAKQKQIQDFIKINRIDILHCQEKNIEEDSFLQCNFISSSFNIIQNNSVNKYGTATLIRSDFNVENIKMDTQGRAIFFTIEKMTFGNLYLHSGTDAQSRGNREHFCSESVPQLLVNCQELGCIGGDFNCITRAEDCTRHPESKMSPSLKRLIQTFNMKDSFRSLHPDSRLYSRYYSNDRHGDGATRIDRNYHWGQIDVLEAEYKAVAFSDHLAHVIKVAMPSPMDKIISPRTRPFFKTSPEVICDNVFKARLTEAMQSWQKVKDRGLSVLPWWEIIVKPGIRRLAITRILEINKRKKVL